MSLQHDLIEEFEASLLELVEILTPDDHKGKVGVKFRGDDVRLFRDVRVHGKPGMLDPAETVDGADLGREIVFRRLSDNAVFERPALEGNVILCVSERLAESRAYLLSHEIYAVVSLDAGNLC